MATMDKNTRLLVLANLEAGKSPRDVEAMLEGKASYPQILKLRKELDEAHRTESIKQLFGLSEIAMEQLLKSVRDNLEPILADTPMLTALEGELQSIKEGVDGLEELDKEFQSAAQQIAIRIKQQAMVADSPDTLSTLAAALVRLQDSFFKQGPELVFDDKLREFFNAD